MGITNVAIKYVQSLRIKKFRQKYHHFVVEGDKAIRELLASDWNIIQLYHTLDFELTNSLPFAAQVSTKEMERISHHQAPQNALAIVEIPHWEKALPTQGIQLYLDGIQDPGNLGTLIRIADWYGVKQLWCSADTVDMFNPKCIDASMGSFLRVKQLFEEPLPFINACTLPSYAATMEGANIHHASLPANAVILIGNEGKGLRKELLDNCDNKISIPRIGNAESLNAAVATAIILDNFCRNA